MIKKLDKYQIMIEVLKLVASNAEIQINVFPNYVNKPDEVALTYDEVISSINELVSNNVISIDQYNKLININDYFDSYPINEWTEKSMYSSEYWKKSREMALELLSGLNLQYSLPNLFWINYVKNE